MRHSAAVSSHGIATLSGVFVFCIRSLIYIIIVLNYNFLFYQGNATTLAEMAGRSVCSKCVRDDGDLLGFCTRCRSCAHWDNCLICAVVCTCGTIKRSNLCRRDYADIYISFFRMKTIYDNGGTVLFQMMHCICVCSYVWFVFATRNYRM